MTMSVRITAWTVTEDFLLPDMNLSTAHTSLNLILLIILSQVPLLAPHNRTQHSV